LRQRNYRPNNTKKELDSPQRPTRFRITEST
jgi:hypothetical protein